MITPKLKEIQSQLSTDLKRGQRKKLITQFWDELIRNCKPTRQEFEKHTSQMLITSGTFYLIMKACGVWKE